MIEAFENYTFLVGSHGRRGSLWKGPDHLLVVEGRGVLLAFSEHYRRIDYTNIQALGFVRTVRYGWLIAAFALPAVVFLIGLLATLDEPVGFRIGFGVPLTLCLGFLAIHLRRGPTVRCTLQTSVQMLRLRPVTRERVARRVMAELAEICRQHQGGEAENRRSEASGAVPTTPPRGARPMWQGSPAAIVGGVLLFLWGLVLGVELFVPGVPFLMLDFFLALAATLGALFAAVAALRHHSPVFLHLTAWGSFLGGLVGLFVALVGFVAAGAVLDRRLAGSSSPGQTLVFLADFPFAETNGVGWLLVGLGAFVGLVGLVLVAYGVRKAPAAVAPPPMPPPRPTVSPVPSTEAQP